MSMIKSIPGIEPYNEVFYRSCYYNSFIPVVKQAGKSILPFFIHEFPVYSTTGEQEMIPFDVEYQVVRDLSQLLDETGFTMMGQVKSERISDDLVDAIMQDHPVIVWVDSFYEPFRKDTYQKRHWAHSLLVYGYNQFDETFEIIEHHHADNLTYEKRKLDFTDMEQAYEGYQEQFLRGEEYTFFEFGLNQDKAGLHLAVDENVPQYRFVYLNNLQDQVETINNGIEKLVQMEVFFAQLIQDEQQLKGAVGPLLDKLTTIINAKKAEQYKLAQLQVDSTITDVLNEIVLHWSYIRGVVGKSLYSNVFKQEDFRLAGAKLSEIVELERRFYLLLLKK
ncbi:BtrH N-terminal domain-containing protein [Brevibacillus dissolubilis]|uniref:BtrH N-terminal domain-containing protein n=1 Tax=Brevibacillus dissolubilis TaxID=1844116 RepID=UPI00159BB396|nr:BtrH N-terminal domain-containing protein [Brevibacillus dissolubilis]